MDILPVVDLLVRFLKDEQVWLMPDETIKIYTHLALNFHAVPQVDSKLTNIAKCMLV